MDYLKLLNVELRTRLAYKYKNISDDDCNFDNEWWIKFNSLSLEKLEIAKFIIAKIDLKMAIISV